VKQALFYTLFMGGLFYRSPLAPPVEILEPAQVSTLLHMATNHPPLMGEKWLTVESRVGEVLLSVLHDTLQATLMAGVSLSPPTLTFFACAAVRRCSNLEAAQCVPPVGTGSQWLVPGVRHDVSRETSSAVVVVPQTMISLPGGAICRPAQLMQWLTSGIPSGLLEPSVGWGALVVWRVQRSQ
jgi:hypothetical protein